MFGINCKQTLSKWDKIFRFFFRSSFKSVYLLFDDSPGSSHYFFCSWSLLTIHISIQSPNARLNTRRPFDFYTPKMETFKGHVECTLFCLLCICFRQRFQEQTEIDRLYLWFVSFRLCLLSAETEMNSSYRNDWEYL